MGPEAMDCGLWTGGPDEDEVQFSEDRILTVIP